MPRATFFPDAVPFGRRSSANRRSGRTQAKRSCPVIRATGLDNKEGKVNDAVVHEEGSGSAVSPASFAHLNQSRRAGFPARNWVPQIAFALRAQQKVAIFAL